MNFQSTLLLLKKIWLSLSHVMNLVMSTIMMTLLWITAFGIYAVLWKIARLLQCAESKNTYWIDVDSKKQGTMRQQF